jgi:hypothetical protein
MLFPKPLFGFGATKVVHNSKTKKSDLQDFFFAAPQFGAFPESIKWLMLLLAEAFSIDCLIILVYINARWNKIYFGKY